jgi:hypothetical protein
MSSASDLQASVATTREALERVEADANQALTLLSDLEDALERLRRGDEATTRGESVAALTDDVRPAFEPLERAAFEDRLDDLATAYDDYQPQAMADAAATLRRAAEDDDADALEDGTDGVLDAFGDRALDTVHELLEHLYEAYEADDDRAFEDAVSEIEARYEALTEDRRSELLDDVERLFGHAYEQAAAAHFQQLRTAFDEQDDAAFEREHAALQSAFDAEHGDVIQRRVDDLAVALRNARDGEAASHIEAFRADATAARRRVHRLTRALNDDLAALVDTYPSDPSQPLAALDDPLQPVALLPVQLETRFTEVDQQGDCQLQIRIYPDDAHVDTHEPELTEDEVAAGRRFWERLWWAAHDVPTSELAATLSNEGHADLVADVALDALPEAAADRHEAVTERAWAALVERVVDRRAAYVKQAMAPDAAAQLLAGPSHDDGLPSVAFEALADDVQRRPGAWTRQPRARLLPDRWVAFVDTGSQTLTATSEHVREPLPIGPEPDLAGAGGSSPDWMTDWPAAKHAGMGLELTVDDARAQQGLESVVVVGVRASATPDATASALEDLLDAHHHTDGLELLAQGTPTNNTGDGATPRSDRTAPLESLDRVVGPPLAAEDTDGGRLARLLGLEPELLGTHEHVFSRVPGADGVDQCDARHANAALWSATWGNAVPNMLAPASAAGSAGGANYGELATWLSAYREHFVEYVRARGPAPTLRLGDQPYGVLPVVPHAEWESLSLSGGSDGGSSDGFSPVTYADRDVESDLVTAIGALRSAWTGSTDDVRTLADISDVSDPVAALLEVLGREPRAVGYRYREGYGRETLLWALTGNPPPFPSGGSNLVDSYVNQVQSSAGAQLVDAALGAGSLDPRASEVLFDDVESEQLGPLVGTETDRYLEKLLTMPFDSIAVADPADRQAYGNRNDAINKLHSRREILPEGRADSLLELLLYYATLQEYAGARHRLGHLYGGQSPSASDAAWHLLPEPEFYRSGDDTIFERLHDQVPQQLASHPEVAPDDSYADVLNAARGFDTGTPDVAPQFQSFVESLRYLRDRDLDETAQELLLTETLDLASYRFDAWMTSLATRRLDAVRDHQAADATDAEPGLYVGGVGWVTDLSKRPDDPVSDGYVHAPSLSQADTAAILRNGSTSFDGERGDLLSLDLSPERVRGALTLIQDVRQGGDLGELLGYRFERALRESDVPVDEYIREFRALEPAVADDMEREGQDDSAVAARRDVVDGLALHRRWDAEQGWGADEPVPADVDLPDSEDDAAQYEAVVDAIEEIGDLLDATSDLLTAESVHQTLQGRPERAGASLDALSRGEAPPELEVVETPRSATALTHRLLVLFDDDPPATGWPSAPRQVRPDAEPNLDAWVADLLPAPDDTACVCAWTLTDEDGLVSRDQIGVRLSELSVAPLDVLAIAEGGADAQRSELEQRVLYYVDRTHGIPDGAEVELTFGPVDEWSYSAAALELGSPDDLVGFGEVLAVAGALQDVVATGRSADAGDLHQGGPAGQRGLDATALKTRGDSVVPALQAVVDDLEAALAVVHDGEQAPAPLVGMTDAADAIGSLPPDGMALSDVATRLEGIDQTELVSELAALSSALDAGVLSLATVDGSVQVEAAANQTVRGRVAASQGRTLTVTVAAADGSDFEASAQATIQPDATFAATLDCSAASASTTLDVTVSTDAGVVASGSGEIVASADGSPSADQAVGPVSTPELDAFAGVARDLAAVKAALEPAVAAFERTDLDALRNYDADVDYATLQGAPDWDATWPSNVDAMVDRLLSVAPLALPDGDDPDLSATGWVRSYEFARLLTDGTDLLAYPAEELSSIAAVLDEVDEMDDATVADDVQSAAATAAAQLRDLAPLAGGTARDAADALRLAAFESVRDALLRGAGFGLGASVPQSARGLDEGVQETLADQAAAVAAAASDRLDAAPLVGAADDAETHLERVEAPFGESFTVLAPFEPTNAGELERALTTDHSEVLLAGDELAVETWFQRAARVRDLPGRFQRALGMAEGLAGPVADAGLDAARFRVAQLPFESDDDWVGQPDAFSGDPPGGRLSLVTHAATEHGGAPAAGLFVDEWVETVPASSETTGLAFQHDRPVNQPPQSVLLAVPPDRDGWSLARLRDVATETLSMAELRTVDNARLQDLGHFLPALTYAHNTTSDASGPDAISLDFSVLEGGE